MSAGPAMIEQAATSESPGEKRAESQTDAAIWKPVAPIPHGAPRPDTMHPKFGKPVAVLVFKDASGAYQASFRFNVGGVAVFDGLSFWRSPSGKTEWRWAVIPRHLAPPALDRRIDRLREKIARNPLAAPDRPPAKNLESDLRGVILAIFSELDATRLPTKTICRVLSESRGITLTPMELANQLRPSNIRPKLLRIKDQPPMRGYERSAFESPR